MAHSNRRRRNRPASIRNQLDQARQHLRTCIVPHLATHLPQMEDEFRISLRHLIQDAHQNDRDTDFNDLIHQAVILAVMRVLSGNTRTPLDQNHVRHWTYAFRVNSLDEDLDQVFAAVVQDELKAAA